MIKAQDYVDRGLHIIPISRDSKVPPKGVSVVSLRDRLPTPEEMHEWFEVRDYNVALVTGGRNGLLAVDFDLYKEEDEHGPLHKLAAETRSGMWAKSANGGWHYFFKSPPIDAGNRQKVIKGMDIRSTGGYILVEPSTINGKMYEWQEFGEASPVPPTILKMLAPQEAVPEVQVSVRTDAIDEFVHIVQSGFEEGRHNEQVQHAARLMKRMMLSGDEAVQNRFILDVLGALNAKDSTPQPIGQLARTVQSGIEYERKRMVKNGEATKAKPFTTQTAGSLIAEWQDYDVTWLIDGWIPNSSVLMMVAPPESYKTWIGMEAAASVATGISMFGKFAINNQAPVIVIQQEDFVGMQAQRMRAILTNKARQKEWDIIQYNDPDLGYVLYLEHPGLAPIHMHTDGQFKLNNPESVEGLRKVIRKTGAKLVYIDPMYSIMDDTGDYFASGASGILDIIKPIRNEEGASFVFAHHTRKGNGGTGRQEMWGSQLMNGAIEGAWMIYNRDGQLFIEKSGKFYRQRDVYEIGFDISTEPHSERFDVKIEKSNNEALLTGKYDAPVLAILNEAGAGMRATDVAELLGISRKVAGDTLKRLVEKGLIAQAGNLYSTVMEGLE